MEIKIIYFLKKWFINQGDCCPKENLDYFLINEFTKEEYPGAQDFINSLIERKYMKFITKDGKEFLAVSGYGAEMLMKNIF